MIECWPSMWALGQTGLKVTLAYLLSSNISIKYNYRFPLFLSRIILILEKLANNCESLYDFDFVFDFIHAFLRSISIDMFRFTLVWYYKTINRIEMFEIGKKQQQQHMTILFYDVYIYLYIQKYSNETKTNSKIARWF